MAQAALGGFGGSAPVRPHGSGPASAIGHDRMVEPALARTIWHRIESLNAVTYFAPECRDAPSRLGLQGFWMGYFACRAAPMGPVPAAVVEATFFNFHPGRVRRAIPGAWTVTDPSLLVAVRAEAAAAALRRLLGEGAALSLAAAALPDLERAVDHASGAGRPLFAANRQVPRLDDPVAMLWQAATTLREHRGDGHVALLVGADLGGCEAHALFTACEGVTPELFQQSRGWSSEEWSSAVEGLAARGLLRDHGAATEAGHRLHHEVEARTDELATPPYAALGDERLVELVALLGRAADTVVSAGEILFPNPMGLPQPQRNDGGAATPRPAGDAAGAG